MFKNLPTNLNICLSMLISFVAWNKGLKIDNKMKLLEQSIVKAYQILSMIL